MKCSTSPTNFRNFTVDAKQAKLWKHDHTIWGEIVGKEAVDTVDAVYTLPVKGSGTHTRIDRHAFTLRYVDNQRDRNMLHSAGGAQRKYEF